MVFATHEIGSEPAPLRWTATRYLAAVEAGVIEEGRGVELIGGAIMTDPPQGAAHQTAFFALQRAFGPFVRQGLFVGPTVVLSDSDVYDPEFALLRAEYDPRELPRAADVLWAVEVSVSSRHTDLNAKKAGYAAAGVPEYWVVDAAKRGLWVFTNPADGEYRQGTFVPAGETLTVPVIGATLDTGAVFPPEPV